MTDLSAWLSEIGLPHAIELDGKIHRVTRGGRSTSKSAWYVGWTDPFLVVVAGDWKTGERWDFKACPNLTKAETRKLRARINIAQAEAAVERERARTVVALRADIVLRSAPLAVDHPYLARKQVDAFGLHLLGDELLVPVRDISGATWGYERILADGTKLFLSNQRVEGCFHHIVGSPGRIFIAEGYATAASVHMATGDTVFCAYHAGNLKSVALQAAVHYPKAEVVIAGDDDVWTDGNPGRTKALAALQAIGGRAIFPSFQDLDGRPTDFNDLHCREGLAAVRRAVNG